MRRLLLGDDEVERIIGDKYSSEDSTTRIALVPASVSVVFEFLQAAVSCHSLVNFFTAAFDHGIHEPKDALKLSQSATGRRYVRNDALE